MSDISDSESDDGPNMSRLREMALRGDNYRKEYELSYYGMEGTLHLSPLNDLEFLPIAAMLEDRLDMEPDEAKEALEDGRDEGSIDPAKFDDQFIAVMAEAVVISIDTSKGLAEGMDDSDLRDVFGIDEDGNPDDDAIGLQGGKTLELAEEVLEITSDAEKAEAFRRDGGG